MGYVGRTPQTNFAIARSLSAFDRETSNDQTATQLFQYVNARSLKWDKVLRRSALELCRRYNITATLTRYNSTSGPTATFSDTLCRPENMLYLLKYWGLGIEIPRDLIELDVSPYCFEISIVDQGSFGFRSLSFHPTRQIQMDGGEETPKVATVHSSPHPHSAPLGPSLRKGGRP